MRSRVRISPPRLLRTTETTVDRLTGAFEISGIVVEHEARVPHQPVRIELERELCRIFGGGQSTGGLCCANQFLDSRGPLLLDRRDLVLDRAGMRVELCLDRGEETAPGKDPLRDVIEEAAVQHA